MGTIEDFTSEKLIVGVLSTRLARHSELEAELVSAFGEIEASYGPYPFTYTDYYEPEMGPDIQRMFYVCKALVSPGSLSTIKRTTDSIEELFAEEGMRKINLDPGILSRDRFILATTKDRGHRIPLQDGIYGEVTLIYMNKGFQSLSWTYTDFKTEEYRNLLAVIRKSYLKQLREDSMNQ